jgi:hypothetical protein
MNPTYDMPKNYYFGGGSQESFFTPLAAVILCIAIILMFGVRRKSLITPLLAAGVLLPFDLNVVAMGFHISALRLLLLAGWLRVAVSRDIHLPRMNSLDKAVLCWALCNAIFFSLLWATMGSVNNRLGFLWTTLGTYFLVRVLIRDKPDVLIVIRMLAILMAIIAPFMLIERFTQRNAFSIVGAPLISAIRDGKIRGEGPFGHSIIAGTIAAMVLPLFIGLWWQGKQYRKILGLGVASSIGMVIASSSSTPLMTAVAGVFALSLWQFRSYLGMVRWVLVLCIAGLQMAMKSPIWFLIARAGSVVGGSGYHRAMLIDTFVRHFSDWWMIGTRNNQRWGYDMWDVDNAYVAAGLGGGLLTFIAFVAVLVYAYKSIAQSRRLAGLSGNDEHLVWAIGASLFANTAGFVGIIYFDQSILIWYSLLAMVSASAVFNVPGRDIAGSKTAGMKARNINRLVAATNWYHSTRYTS